MFYLPIEISAAAVGGITHFHERFENMRDCEYDHVWKKEVINMYSS